MERAGNKLMEKMLITGATGFLGKNFLQYVNKEKYEICSIHRAGSIEGVKGYYADIFDKKCIADIMTGIQADILVLFAWNVKSQAYWCSMENHKWADIMLFIAEQFLNHGGRYIIFAGTSAIYDYSYEFLVEDRKMEHPDTVYGISKLYTSEMLRNMAESKGAKYLEARLFSIFGIYERKGRLITNTIDALSKNQQIVNHKWKLERDYIYIKDAAMAISHLIDLKSEGVYNISSGKTISIETIIRTIAYCMGKEELITLSDFDGSNEYMLIQGDNKKLLDTGFQIRYSFEDAVAEEIDWYTNSLKYKV